MELLREQGVALVIADTAGKWPFMEDTTSDFVYVRLHGNAELYVSGYTKSALDVWKRKVRAWSEGRTPAGAKLIATDRTPLAAKAEIERAFVPTMMSNGVPFEIHASKCLRQV